jgi:hypothetical protein
MTASLLTPKHKVGHIEHECPWAHPRLGSATKSRFLGGMPKNHQVLQGLLPAADELTCSTFCKTPVALTDTAM